MFVISFRKRGKKKTNKMLSSLLQLNSNAAKKERKEKKTVQINILKDTSKCKKN
jgi:hypothetical protein